VTSWSTGKSRWPANHGGLVRRSPPQAATFATRPTHHVRQAAAL